jgi:hypothetical protein
MTTRKSKPDFPSMIELPTERLQPVTITVEHKDPAHGSQSWQGTQRPVFQSLPLRGKITLH